jgi:copper chaperone CopZ
VSAGLDNIDTLTGDSAMKTAIANVIVYVKQPVHQEQSHMISEWIGALQGVEHAQASARTQSLISVDYDPTKTDSQHILQSVSGQGYTARLIGM